MTTPAPTPNQASILTKAGWIAISCGLLLLLISALAFAFSLLLGKMPEPAHPLPGPLAQLGAIAVVHLVIAVVTIIGGAAILRGHAWARTVLEGLCWTTTLAIVVFTVGLLRLLISATQGAEPVIGLAVVYGFTGLSYLLGVVLAIRALRSEAMYDALEEHASRQLAANR